LFGVKLLWSQDLPVSQFHSNLGLLNPAFAGTTGGARANFFFRDQWPQSDAGSKQFGIVYDRSFSQYHSGLGIIFLNELSGLYLKPSVHLIYSYQIELGNEFFISMALEGGMVQKYFSTSDLNLKDKSEVIPSGLSRIYPDFGTGVVGFYRQLFGGVAVNHLSEPYQGDVKTADTRINRKYTFHLGYLYEMEGRLLNQERIISPNILVQLQGTQQNITWNLNGQYDGFLAGIGIRHNFKAQIDALIFFGGIKTKQMRITYSYDMNIGKIVTYSTGAHEISITVLWDTKTKKKHNVIKCPSFLM